MNFWIKDFFPFFRCDVPLEIRWLKIKQFLIRENINFIELKKSSIKKEIIEKLEDKICFGKLRNSIGLLKDCNGILKNLDLFEEILIIEKKNYCLIWLKTNFTFWCDINKISKIIYLILLM